LNNNDYGEQISGMPYKLRKMKHIDIRDSEQFYKLLRLSLRLTQEFPVDVSAETWRRLYQTAVRQSLVGICYQGVCLLPEGSKPPVEIAMQWASEAESIRGLNELLYQEAARLTRKFAEKGRRTAILKGQANARLYPDKYARQPGDIDIWAEGGRESVLALLPNHEKPSYHHVHLPANENGVVVEVHFRPSSGNFNPITNRRLQRWLEREILSASMVEEGFCVPSVRFALVMQLAHVQRHFLASGLGLRHVCDYYWLLQNSTAEDLRVVAGLLKEFGLHHAAGALMWVIGKVLHLDSSLMLCEADSYRGEWMLREIMAGGNFGWYAERQKHNVFRRVLEGRLRHLRLMPFDFWEMLWLELRFWKAVVVTLPIRIKYRTLSLRDIPR
jgi:hypothetical protein